MKKLQYRLFALASALAASLLAPAAMAATYYVADCQSGAVAGCVAGNDANSGTSASAPWQSTGKVQGKFSQLKPDDKVLFARGGVWVNAEMTLQNQQSSAAHPITLDAYTPSWGATRKPMLKETRPGHGLINFTDGGEPEADGGYVVRNLDLRGGGTGDTGIFTSQKTSDILLESLHIEGFRLGVYCGDAIQRVNLRNSTFINNRGAGLLWACFNSTVENNRFDNNGWERAIFDHTIYIAGPAGFGPSNMVFRGNTMTRNAMHDGICQAVPLVVHGVIDGLTIEYNLIEQEPGTATGGCWGIAVDGGYGEAESFKRVAIRGNRVVNVGGLGIGCGACVAPVIENNVIINEDGAMQDFIGIAIPDRERGPGDAADTGAIVRNNTIYFAKTPKGAVGIRVAPQGTTMPGSQIQVISNIIRFGSGATGAWCYDLTGMRRSDFKYFDNNMCYHIAAGRYSNAYATLADAQKATYDEHGTASGPWFVGAPTADNGWSLPIKSGSPARDKGHANSAALDILKVVRSKPDMGAHEYVPPAARKAAAAD